MMLASLQSDFRNWLVSGCEESAVCLGAGSQARSQTGSQAGSQVGLRAGLAAYRNNYRSQLVDCLESAFPMVRAWLGGQAFLYAAVKHVGRNPPHAWTLDAYADGFHLTLAAMFPHNPDLHELAWIESALNTAFVAADAAPLAAADLASVDWETARLRFTPSLQTARSVTNAADIWRAMRDGGHRPDGEMLDEPRGLVVWRRGLVSRLYTASLLELEALVHMRTCGNFSSLCTALVERLGESEGVAKAGAFLAGWVTSELVTGIGQCPAEEA